ncbi:hypothetical protein [Bacillus altitudinis]|uniref:hypothetical protein n=1 Tax=Bacillus altitudinis TaxID=293387 RepID=UPI001643754F|nr:hypothetical protein [Bacillus altitudinis]
MNDGVMCFEKRKKGWWIVGLFWSFGKESDVVVGCWNGNENGMEGEKIRASSGALF